MEGSRQVVREGYEVIGEDYDSRRQKRERANIDWLDSLAPYLPTEGTAVDLGCGAGVPITRYFADRGFTITGYDLSPKMIDLARQNVPNASFEGASMEDLDLMPSSLDLVVSFYAIIHVDRDKHELLFKDIFRWLRTGGKAFLCLGANDNPSEYADDWGGAPMYWSHFDAETNLALLRKVGFEVVWHEIDEMPTERFLNVIVQK